MTGKMLLFLIAPNYSYLKIVWQIPLTPFSPRIIKLKDEDDEDDARGSKHFPISGETMNPQK